MLSTSAREVPEPVARLGVRGRLLRLTALLFAISEAPPWLDSIASEPQAEQAEPRTQSEVN